MLDACVDEVEGSFNGYGEYWKAIGKAGNTFMLEVLAEEVQNKRHPMRQACLLDLIRSGEASVNQFLFCDIAFEMMRQEIANLSHESTLLTQRDEDGMYLINAIMQNLYWESYMPYEIEKYRNEFIEIAFLVGKFEYQEDSDKNDFSFYFLDCAIEKIINTLGSIASGYASVPALTCLQEISRHYKHSFFANEALKEYVEAWRYLNIAYKIHYNHEEIDAPTIDWKVLYELTETAIKQEYADFALYGSDNMWLRMLKSGENIVLFYQDKNEIVYHSQNIDALDDETLIPFILRDDRVIHLPTAFKIYCLEMGLLEFLFHDLIRKGEVRARKKDKKHLSLNTMYFGLEKCDKDYLG